MMAPLFPRLKRIQRTVLSPVPCPGPPVMTQTVVSIAQQNLEAAHSPEPVGDTGVTTMSKPKSIRILLAGDNDGRAAQALRALFCDPEHELELTAVSTLATLLPTLGVVSAEIMV